MAKILIVDDEEKIRSSLKSALERRSHEVVTADSFAQGRKFLGGGFDIIFLDVMLGDGSGLDLLTAARQKDPRQTVVMISGHADIDMAVDAIRAGAYDFIEKPLSLDRLTVTIDNAVRTLRLQDETERLSSLAYGEFVGESKAVKNLKKDIARSAPKANRFLILGENGTGKELVANMIHRAGSHRDGPFVPVNCAALPSELVESELFGHVKGAFTGASANRQGKFVQADRGSIFLDEISEMPLEAQAKILRVLETREVTPVGSNKTVTVDCTVIAASNRDLQTMIDEKTFREDLLYRLNVVQFNLPPLRDRLSDIPLLAFHFLNKFATESGSPPKKLNEPALSLLQHYKFPGNIRELKNLMERVNIYVDRDTVTSADIKRLMPGRERRDDRTLREAVDDFERDYIEEAIARNDGNISQAAQELGVERSLIYKKLKKNE